MKRLLGIVAILAGFVWAVLYGLAVNGREDPAGEWARSARAVAFVTMIAAGSVYPSKRKRNDVDEEL